MLINQSVNNILDGVSQQAITTRLESQAEEQTNARSVKSKGIVKRPPTKFRFELDFLKAEQDYFFHLINEETLLIIGDDNIYVTDMQKNIIDVQGAFTNYLRTESKNLKAYTIAGSTYILNTDITVLADENTVVTADTNPIFYSLISINKSIDKHTYEIERHQNGVYISTLASVKVTNANATREDIAKLLYDDLQTKDSNKNHLLIGDIILVARKNKKDKLVINSDSNNSIFNIINDTAQSINDLPQNFTYDGFRVEITGLTKTNESKTGYFMKSTAEGFWVESTSEDAKIGLLKSTMPMQLLHLNNSYKLEEIDWGTRKVGDNDSNPDPYFVNNKILDLAYFHNRLEFLTHNSKTLSATGQLTNFYLSTLTVSSATDPINIKPLSKDSFELRFIAQAWGHLVTFAEKSQFVLSVGRTEQGLTATNINIAEYTHYDTDNIEPVALNDYIYFCSGNRVLELQQLAENKYTAVDTTLNIPTYIDAPIKKLLASSKHNMLFALTTDHKLYVYSYEIIDNKKSFSSWSRWHFSIDYEIVSINNTSSKLYIVFKIDNKLYLETLDLDLDSKPIDLSYNPHLDSQYRVNSKLINFEDDKCFIKYDDLPFTYRTNHEIWECVTIGLNYYNKLIFDDRNKKVYLKSNVIKGYDLIFGVAYKMKYVFSTFFRRSSRDNSVILGGRLQIRSITVNFSNTGVFDFVIKTNNNDYKTVHTFTAKELDTKSTTFKTNDILLSTDSIFVHAPAKNTNLTASIESDKALPVEINTFSWEAVYVRRSKTSR